MSSYMTLVLEVLAFMSFAVLVAVVPYVRRKCSYWTNRGIQVASDLHALATTLPAIELDDRSLDMYRNNAALSSTPVLGLYDAGRPCALACDFRMAMAALNNDGFAEVNDEDNKSLIPHVINASETITMLSAMNECVCELITSLEAVANRELTIEPWVEVKKCATTVVATCVFGQPMIDSRIKAFSEQCDKALMPLGNRRHRRHRPTPTNYFTTYDLSSNDQDRSIKQLLNTAAVQRNDKISSDVANERVRLDMFKFVTDTIEPTAALVTAALYELAHDQNIQNELREHLDSEIDKYQQHVTIDQLDRLYILENVLRETLRKYPLTPTVRRVVTKPYAVPDGGLVTLEPGTLIVVPVHALHHDSRYFETPEAFQPHRFPEKLSSAYVPHGSGPQSYLGKHFVGLQAKLIIAMLLTRYVVHIDNAEPDVSPNPFDLKTFANVCVKVTNRKNTKEKTLAASLRSLQCNDNNNKKFLFF